MGMHDKLEARRGAQRVERRCARRRWLSSSNRNARDRVNENSSRMRKAIQVWKTSKKVISKPFVKFVTDIKRDDVVSSSVILVVYRLYTGLMGRLRIFSAKF